MQRKKRHLVLMLLLTFALAMGDPGVLSESHDSVKEAAYAGLNGSTSIPDGEAGSGAGAIWIPIPGPEPPVLEPAVAWHKPGARAVLYDLPWLPISPPAQETRSGVTVPTITPRVDVTFCLDTTGSMSDEIEVAKNQILRIADMVENGNPRPDVRYALVVFKDIGDEYVTQVFEFMPDVELAVILQDVEASGGGDYAESVSEALHRSVHDVTWDLEASCAIYLIGDAPPHLDYDNGYCHVQAAQDAADRGIFINAIGCSGIRGSEAEFQQVADMTGGSFVYLSYDGGSSGYSYGTDGEGGGCGTGEGSEDDPGEGTGKGSGCGSGQSQTNDLDEVLTDMIQGQARTQGVEYEGDEDG